MTMVENNSLTRHWRACLLCTFMCIGAVQFGYDSSYFSGVLVIKSFLEQYGHFDAATDTYILTASTQSWITSIIVVGEFVGAASAYYVGDTIGRKKGLYISSSAVVIGTLLQTIPTYIGSLAVGRLLVGYAVGLISCLVPLYIADSAPSRLRGALGAMYQQFIGFGLLLGVIVTATTVHRSDTSAYRIPMSVQLLFPALLLPGLLFFVPESPRWLLEKGKVEKAQQSLCRIHGGCLSHAENDITIMREALANYRVDASFWSEILSWTSEGRKAYLGVAIQAFQQASGINFITSYGISFFSSLGLDNAFHIQLGLYIIGFPSIWLSSYLMEKHGRRPTLIVSGILMATCLFTIGTCGVIINKYNLGDSKALDIIIVVMVYVYAFVFNLGWGPVVWVYTSEISTGRNRGRLMSLSASSSWFFAWLVVFTYPYMANADAGNLGPSVGFVYGSLVLGACIWVYFCLPETKGHTLEKIHTMFERRLSVKQFQSSQISINDVTIEEPASPNKLITIVHSEISATSISACND